MPFLLALHALNVQRQTWMLLFTGFPFRLSTCQSFVQRVLSAGHWVCLSSFLHLLQALLIPDQIGIWATYNRPTVSEAFLSFTGFRYSEYLLCSHPLMASPTWTSFYRNKHTQTHVVMKKICIKQTWFCVSNIHHIVLASLLILRGHFDGMFVLVSIVKIVCNVLFFPNAVYYRYVTLTVSFLHITCPLSLDFSISTPSSSSSFPPFHFSTPMPLLCLVLYSVTTSYIIPHGCFAQFWSASVHFTDRKINEMWSECNAGQMQSHKTSCVPTCRSTVVLEGMGLRKETYNQCKAISQS